MSAESREQGAVSLCTIIRLGLEDLKLYKSQYRPARHDGGLPVARFHCHCRRHPRRVLPPADSDRSSSSRTTTAAPPAGMEHGGQ